MERRKEPIVNTKQWEAKDSEADFLSFGEETWKKVTYEAKSEKSINKNRFSSSINFNPLGSLLSESHTSSGNSY